MKWHQWSEKHWDRIWYHVMISPCFYRPRPTTRTHKKSQHVTSLGFAHIEVSIILQFSPVPELHDWNPTIETSLRTGTLICQTESTPFFLEVQSGQFHFELLQSLQKMTLTSQNNHLTKTYLTGWLYFSWLESQGPILIASENPKKALRTMKLQCFISRQHWVSSWGDLIGYETYSDFPFSLDNI